MFMHRLITTLILVPLVLLILFYANPWVLGGILLIVSFQAARECWQLIPVTTMPSKSVFLAVLFLVLFLSGYIFNYWLNIGMLFWALACLAIVFFPTSQRYWGYSGIVAAACIFTWSLFVQSLAHLYFLPLGKELIVYLLFVVWAADIGAYLSGKQWGKHKLIPQVSPGKSWEGITGGLILALVVALVGELYFAPSSLLNWYILAFITTIISIFGDLFISILKRRCHLKDTGNIIPGHGGILDRLDSLNAAVPVFYFGLIHLNF